MTDSLEEERQEILEAKKRALQRRLEDNDADATGRAPSEPIVIDGVAHFQEVVGEYDVVLVDCHADWCGPCQMLEPTIEALAAETDAAVAKVDVDRNQQLAQQLGARSVPTIVFYADGDPVEQLVGVHDRARLESLIERYS